MPNLYPGERLCQIYSPANVCAKSISQQTLCQIYIPANVCAKSIAWRRLCQIDIPANSVLNLYPGERLWPSQLDRFLSATCVNEPHSTLSSNSCSFQLPMFSGNVHNGSISEMSLTIFLHGELYIS